MKAVPSRSIAPAKNLSGALRLPGDKSISHRYAMLGALASGTTKLANYCSGADCHSTLRCVARLGATVSTAENVVEVQGTSGGLVAPGAPLDCGNSGSTMRMLAGILSGQHFDAELIGDESLSRRPMMRVVEPLASMGADIRASDGRPPLRIRAANNQLKAIRYEMPVPSAQVKSAVLFAGLHAAGETTVEENIRTRDHSELALRAFGAEVTRARNAISIRGGQRLTAIEATVPGDISSASFFLCASGLFPEANLVLEDLLLNPTRAGMLDVLTEMGARVSVINLEEKHGELVGTVKLEAARLRGTTINGARSAQLIDELPVLAAIAPFTSGGVEIRDASELRVKESDRIATVAANLKKMGAQVTEHADGLSVPGNQRLHGAELDSAGDHRIAMAFAVCALRAEGESVIHGADAADISFPGFWDMLEVVAER
jgi:3-phosphoshikimate 1-carboxyvinyltransferase